MNILNYKGFEITLDISTGKFTADGATHRNSKEFESTSLASIKTKINDFIKENASFGAFKVRYNYKDTYNLDKLKNIITVKGVSSNKRLTIENSDGKTGTIGKYDIDNLVIYNEDDDKIIDACLKIKEEDREFSKKCNDKIKKLMSEITEVKLSQFLTNAGIDVNMSERGY